MAAKDFLTRFLSDFSRWRVDKAADDLDDVSEAAGRSDRALEGVEGAARSAGRELEGMDAGRAGRGLDDVDDAARRAEGGLDDVASSAREAEGDLSSVGTKAKDAGRDVDAAGDDADAAAERIADAFKKIKKSSDDDLGGIGDGARKGTREVSEASKEMGGEVREELVSMAGSFDGTFSSAADSAQALTSAIAQSLGPLGVGIGAGLALGIGLFRASVERSKETVASLAERLAELRAGTSDVDEVTKGWLDGVEDRGATLRELRDDADALGISIDVLARAHAGDAEALGEVAPLVKEVSERNRELTERLSNSAGVTQEMADQVRPLSGAVRDLAETSAGAREEADLYAAAIGKTSEAAEAARQRQEELGQALGDFIDPASLYEQTLQEMAQATADKTKDQKDSWETYADSTEVSLQAVNDGLRKQVEAQEAWAQNMARVAERASTETLDYLRELGPSGAGLVKELANASDAEMAEFEALMKRRSAAGVASVASAIDDGTAPAVLAARRQREAIAAVYAEKITAMVEVKADPRSISLVRQEAAQAARGGFAPRDRP